MSWGHVLLTGAATAKVAAERMVKRENFILNETGLGCTREDLKEDEDEDEDIEKENWGISLPYIFDSLAHSRRVASSHLTHPRQPALIEPTSLDMLCGLNCRSYSKAPSIPTAIESWSDWRLYQDG